MVNSARPIDINATGNQEPLSQEAVRIMELEAQVDTLIDEREKLRVELEETKDELSACMAMAVVNEQALKLTDKQRADWIDVFRIARAHLKSKSE